MLEKRNGRIGLKDEGPLHELLVIEVETTTGLEQQLGWCVLCGNTGRGVDGNWDKPCPSNVVLPLDRCEWIDQDGKCSIEGAVLLDDDRWLCHQHALEVEVHLRPAQENYRDNPAHLADRSPPLNPLFRTLGAISHPPLNVLRKLANAWFGVAAILLAATACIATEGPVSPGNVEGTMVVSEPTPDIVAMVVTQLTRTADTITPQPTPTAAERNHSISILHITPPPSRPASTPHKLHSGPTIAALVSRLRPSLAKIRTPSGYGSGFVYQSNGLVATNAHVVDCCSTVRVLVNHRTYSGTVLGRDDNADVAVVQINSSLQFQTAQFANTNSVAVGAEVLALGFPLDLGNDPTVTRGIVSSRRTLNGYDYFQHDASINPGNSGGPLIDLDGFVIGMNTAKRFDAEGVGFALTANEIEQRLDTLATGTPSAIPQPRPSATPRPELTATPRPQPTNPPAPTMQPERTREPGTPFEQVSAGWIYTCGVADDEVMCWGWDGHGGQSPLLGKLQEVSVSVGGITACGIRADGQAVCWGGPDPMASPPPGPFQQVSAGVKFNCALKSDRTVDCWSNDRSQEISSPNGEFQQVSSGGKYSCGIRTNGTVSCWNEDGNWLTRLPTGEFHQVSTGLYHSCAVRDSGAAVCWTDLSLMGGIKPDGTHGTWTGNDDGQATAPTGKFRSVSAGAWHSCGVLVNNSIVCWGNDEYGQASAPPGAFLSVSAGGRHTCGVEIDGNVECWGRNGHGQATPPE